MQLQLPSSYIVNEFEFSFLPKKEEKQNLPKRKNRKKNCNWFYNVQIYERFTANMKIAKRETSWHRQPLVLIFEFKDSLALRDPRPLSPKPTVQIRSSSSTRYIYHTPKQITPPPKRKPEGESKESPAILSSPRRLSLRSCILNQVRFLHSLALVRRFESVFRFPPRFIDFVSGIGQLLIRR